MNKSTVWSYQESAVACPSYSDRGFSIVDIGFAIVTHPRDYRSGLEGSTLFLRLNPMIFAMEPRSDEWCSRAGNSDSW